MCNPRVVILLATYRGAAYLPELLASLREQTYGDWTLLARDDGSDDDTIQILRDAAACDGRIAILESVGERLGPVGNFGLLMQRALDAGAEYVFFADQDDIWHADKVERQLQCMKESEAGRSAPRLVFCDAAIVDALRRPVHPSFLRQNRLPYSSDRPIETLLGRSFVLGCACAVNRPLLEFALPLPETVASHDWWLALCAACVGRIECIDVPLLDYRRHESNASAAAFWSMSSPPSGWRRRWEIGWRSFMRSLDQARALRERLQERKVDASVESQLLSAFCDAMEQPDGWRRLWRADCVLSYSRGF